jgi:hypothetical protein
MTPMDLQSVADGEPGGSRDRGPGGGRSRTSLGVPLRARLWLAGGGLAAVALVIVLLSTSSGNGSTVVLAPAAAGRVTTASIATFHRALVARLDAQHATYHWVACVRSGKRFAGVPIVRCNVNFGDPHIQAYCSVFRGGRLLTSQEDPAIPCGHDNAGYSFTMETYR